MPVTIKDLSNTLGLSHSTISKALNDRGDVSSRTRERVLKAAHELGYQPSAAARNLRRQRSDKIGLVVNYPIHQVSDFLAELIPGLATSAEEAAYNLILYTSMAGNEARITNLCRSREVDGIIVAWPPRLSETAALCRLMSDERMPHIVLPRRVPHDDVSYVAADHKEGARLLTGPSHQPRASADRLRAFARGLRDRLRPTRRLRDRPAPSRHQLRSRLGHRGPIPARTTTKARTFNTFMELPQPPTAILFFTDPVAIKVLSLAKARGIRVPDDLSITGFDGVLSSGVTEPALTTVRQPLPQMGRLAVESLLRLIADETVEPQQHTLPVELIIRRSTGLHIRT